MTGPARYIKKPVEVDAMQWDGTRDGAVAVTNWLKANGASATWVVVDVPDDSSHTSWITILTLEGPMRARPYWWVIRGVIGEFYACEPAVFQATYEAA